jgi:hypothetical protein
LWLSGGVFSINPSNDIDMYKFEVIEQVHKSSTYQYHSKG